METDDAKRPALSHFHGTRPRNRPYLLRKVFRFTQ